METLFAEWIFAVFGVEREDRQLAWVDTPVVAVDHQLAWWGVPVRAELPAVMTYHRRVYVVWMSACSAQQTVSLIYIS